MRRTTVSRVLGVGALTAALGAAGPADSAGAAGAAVGPPYIASLASTVLADADFGLVSHVSVTQVRGQDPVVDVALYAEGLSCVLEGSPTTVESSALRSATAVGTYTYVCTEEGGHGFAPLTGTADLAVVWTGVGTIERGPMYHCVGVYLLRDAEVTGGLTLTGDLRRELTPIEDSTHLAYDHNVCPPGIE